MVDYWSLVIFTILGQSAAGIMMLLALSRRATRSAVRRTWVAVIILIAAAVASLGHLADPTISYFAVTNVLSSWLSREILFAGLFGAAMLLWIIFRRCRLLRLAALVGLAFVYVMSRVYIIPTEPFWNSLLTFWSFLSTAFLLGASLLLLLDELGARCRAGGVRQALLGRLPAVAAIAVGFRLIFLLLQLARPRPISEEIIWLEIVEIALLTAGGGLGMLLLTRRAAALPPALEPVADAVALPPGRPVPHGRAEPIILARSESLPPETGETGKNVDGVSSIVAEPVAESAPEATPSGLQARDCRAGGLVFWTLVAVALVWTAEICGRVLFYKSYVWFGM